MIKIKKDHNCESYWYKDGLYDTVRVKEHRITLFGITIYKHTDSYKCDLKSISENKCGFNNNK
jgi:hypothetical protein